MEALKARIAKEGAEVMDLIKKGELPKEEISRHWKNYVGLWYEALKRRKYPRFRTFEGYMNNEYDIEHAYHASGVMEDFEDIKALERQEERGRMWKELPHIIKETKV